jgi:tRNA (guanine10-N2)-dimethyltransferase
MNYAILNLNNIFLSLDELRALIHGNEREYLYGVAIYEGDPKIAQKSAFIKKSGEVLSISSDVKDIIEKVRGMCFSVDLNVLMREYKSYAIPIYSEIIKNVKTSRNCEKLDLILTEGKTVIAGIRKAEKDSKSLISHSKRPYTQSGTLNPELGRVMVNLSESREIYDPFVGTGTILIEAKWLGLKCVGSDIDLKMLSKAKENLKYFGYECDLFQTDSRKIPIKKIESIVTDPPYGRSFSPKGLSELYEEFFYNASEHTNTLVFSTDFKFDWRDKLKEAGFKDIKIHMIYEHKSLSRAVYVVRKNV